MKHELKLIWISIKYLRWGCSTHKFSWKLIIRLMLEGVRFDPNNRINGWNARVR